MAASKISTFDLEDWFSTDTKLNRLYPKYIRILAGTHWSPLYIVRKAIAYLVQNEEVKVLDIGSGVGKFCLAGAYYKPSATFFGVEQRKDLVEHAENAKKILGFKNVGFAHLNFTQLNLKQYDHFYFYNSFFENLEGADKIDNTIEYSDDLYSYYCHYLYKQLEEMPSGTRVVTYCSWGDEIPPCYQLVESHLNSLLNFWIRK